MSETALSFSRTNREIGHAIGRHRRRKGLDRRLPSMIRAIDGLLAEVEDLNLRDVRQVPQALRERVAELVAGTVGELPQAMPTRWRTGYAMDLLYDAQRRLTQRRSLELGLPIEDAGEFERD